MIAKPSGIAVCAVFFCWFYQRIPELLLIHIFSFSIYYSSREHSDFEIPYDFHDNTLENGLDCYHQAFGISLRTDSSHNRVS